MIPNYILARTASALHCMRARQILVLPFLIASHASVTRPAAAATMSPWNVVRRSAKKRTCFFKQEQGNDRQAEYSRNLVSTEHSFAEPCMSQKCWRREQNLTEWKDGKFKAGSQHHV